MGYTTDFKGEFKLDRPLTVAQRLYLEKFAHIRHMKRDTRVLGYDAYRIAVDLPVGVDGEFYIGTGRDRGQAKEPSILLYNTPPSTQPGLWCQWTPNEAGDAIVWDGGEKFYEYVPWLRYIIDNFLKPWGYTLNGEVEWVGEDRGDTGKIQVVNNKVHVFRGRTVYEGGDEDEES